VNLITLIVVIKNKSSVIGKVEQKAGVKVAAAEQPVQGIVFCRSCGNQYDSTLAACPHCKTARS
jgi:predicted Zn-ribbon and HTH transcriptional regulator